MFKPISENHNFIEMEKKWLRHWYEKGIVKKYLKKNKNSKKYFSFIDGPITANNPMGVHHAWGRTFKDLWPKFFNLLGYWQRFQNGFDCQGLWVEVEVEKELGLKTKKDIENLIPGKRRESIDRFVNLCKERVRRFSQIQTEQSKRLGYFADWDHSYFTMSDENNYMIWHFLKKCYENGWIYQGRESVPWCPRCETAISEHEILTEDYKEVVHKAVYFKLKIKNSNFSRKAGSRSAGQFSNKFLSKSSNLQNSYLLVWTTTPWTIPANIAVAVDKDIDYALVLTQKGEKLWLARDLIDTVLGSDKKEILQVVKGKELAGLKYEGPFDDLPAVKKVADESGDKFHFVFVTDQNILPVTTEEGTGMVHTAVSAGTEDFKMGRKLGLPMIPVIKDNAEYLETMGWLAGKNAKKHPEIILDYLEKNGYAYKIHNYKHRYPACWRCKTELVWKVADEWYIAMDKKSSKLKTQSSKLNKTLRQRMIEVAKKIRWIPEFGLDRELDWLKNMHDWLISKKNRFWGLALPIYHCRKCGFFEVIGSKEELKNRAVEGWEKFEGHSPHKPWIDEVKIQCQKCGAKVGRIDDVGNPWLDAGIVPFSTITRDNQGPPLYLTSRKEWQKWFPADFITESFPGQFKNWFYSLIAMATVLENTNPFKTVLGYGTLLGEDGRPMHKSWGNAIEFNEGAEKIGVDVMRWMYCRHDPKDNLLFGYKKADEVRRQFYLMLWNAYKFFIEYINLDQVKLKTPACLQARQSSKLKAKTKNSKLKVIDQWILIRLIQLIEFVEKSLRDFNVKDAALEIEKFVSDLSTWYIRRSRDRVWVNNDDKDDKEAFYQTLYFVLVNLSIVLSPFIPFISEEIYTNLTGEESVHLSQWPKLDWKLTIENWKLVDDMNLVREIVEVGHRVRKEKKIKVRQPLKAMTIELTREKKFNLEANLSQYFQLIAEELNVKKVFLSDKKSSNDEIEVIYDLQITEDLKKEGDLREIIRQIQAERKLRKLKPIQPIILTLPKTYADFEEIIKRKVMAKSIKWGEGLLIES